MRLVDPNGAASCAACSLGAFAGKKALLLPCVTLLSDGRNFGTAKPAISQAAMTTQRNLTASAPIPPNMAWMRPPPAYKQAVSSKQAGPVASPGPPAGILWSSGTQMIF
jgi:hypothetical protein